MEAGLVRRFLREREIWPLDRCLVSGCMGGSDRAGGLPLVGPDRPGTGYEEVLGPTGDVTHIRVGPRISEA